MPTETYMTYIRKVIKKKNITGLEILRSNIVKEINKEISTRKRAGIAVKQKVINAEQTKVKPIPINKVRFVQRIKYIKYILDQKWDYLFTDMQLSEENDFYVYAHVDPAVRDFDLLKQVNIIGMPFYIGKGTGQRAWDLSRNQGHGAKIREVIKNGYNSQRIVNIVQPNLTEAKALELEAKLIYIFQTVYEDQSNGVLFNLDKERRPDFILEKKEELYIIKKKSSFGSIIEGRI